MRLRMIAEKKEKDFFDYSHMTEDMWRKKVSEEQDEVKIDFDLENDYEVAQREITVEQDHWDTTKCKFSCELRSAGGDWESPVYYFRCQLKDGFAKRRGKSLYRSMSSHFVYIPGQDEGNQHLVKHKEHFGAPDSNAKAEGQETKVWKSLKAHLKKMVDDEIAEVKKEK